MYILLVYDLNSERTQKMHKFCSKYLEWKQNSVFEGEVTEAQLKEISEWVDSYTKDEETVIIYEVRAKSAIEKHIFGTEESQETII